MLPVGIDLQNRVANMDIKQILLAPGGARQNPLRDHSTMKIPEEVSRRHRRTIGDAPTGFS
jgi:hypothetical protein